MVKIGGRYLISGAQIGTLIALAKHDPQKAIDLLNEIQEDQFIYDSKELLEKDLKQIQARYVEEKERDTNRNTAM